MPSAGPILYLGIIPFHSAWQRPQQLAKILSESAEVLYMDPPGSLLGSLRQRKHPPAKVETALPAGLTLFQPGGILPLSGYLPGVNQWNYAAIGGRLLDWLDRNGIEFPRAIVASFPKQVDLLPRFSGTPVLYDVMDDYPLFFDALQRRKLAGMHQRLLRQADAVVASSQTLADRFGPQSRQCTVITNGVSQHIVDAFPGAVPEPAIERLPSPRLGYIGSISRWFDFDCVRKLAATHPHGSVVVVGPTDILLPAMPANVHFLGPRTQQELPRVLSGFDVGIIPFLRSPEIDAVNPVKVYEYFAAGLPVLSSDFSEIRAFGDLVQVAESVDDWETQSKAALNQIHDPTLRRRRQQLARQNLWSEKGKQFANVLQSLQGRIHRAAA